MYNGTNRLEATERDLAQATSELQVVLDLSRAVQALTSNDPDFIKRSGFTVPQAASMIATANSAMFEGWGSTLAESLDILKEYEAGLREEISSFMAAHDELLLRTRGEAIKFIEAELDRADQQTSDDPKIKYHYDGMREAYKNVLKVLWTFHFEE